MLLMIVDIVPYATMSVVLPMHRCTFPPIFSRFAV